VRFVSLALLPLVCLGAMTAQAQYLPNNPIKHVVVIVQENRTPDNLFQGLCGFGAGCGSGPNQYEIRSTYVDASGRSQPLQPVALATAFDLDHSYGGPNLNGTVSGFNFEYANRGVAGSPGVTVPTICAQNGFGCSVPGNSQFMYVYNSPVNNSDGSKGGLLDPYLTLATRYGWANRMFQTNQGPSYPAHQFLFGGTSAPTPADDAAGVFVSENGPTPDVGCAALPSIEVQLVRPIVPMPSQPPYGTETKNDVASPCFTHQALSDLLYPNITWTYYTITTGTQNGGANLAGSIWTAPNSLSSICIPAKDNNGNLQCTGPYWNKGLANGYVDLNPPDVLTDIGTCQLADVSWVIPDAKYSDHPINQGQGPSWIAAIVNALGNSTNCDNNTGYWQDTAVFITWDDWGGWFDHVAPVILKNTNKYQNQYDYQSGFRVPLIVVSAYSPQTGYINNNLNDFGSILRAIEGIFAVPGGEGALNFADARSMTDLSAFFNFNQAPTAFTTIPAPLPADYFVNYPEAPEAPDND
jgi:phospholipase C